MNRRGICCERIYAMRLFMNICRCTCFLCSLLLPSSVLCYQCMHYSSPTMHSCFLPRSSDHDLNAQCISPPLILPHLLSKGIKARTRNTAPPQIDRRRTSSTLLHRMRSKRMTSHRIPSKTRPGTSQSTQPDSSQQCGKIASSSPLSPLAQHLPIHRPPPLFEDSTRIFSLNRRIPVECQAAQLEHRAVGQDHDRRLFRIWS